MGVWLVTKAARSQALGSTSSIPEMHGGLSPYGFVRLPEFIGRCLGSISPSSSRVGTILPWVANQNKFGSGLSSLSVSLTYSGSIIPTPPLVADDSEVFNFNNAASLVSAYKSVEPYFAAAMNMNLPGQGGDSLLDSTVLLDQNQAKICGLVSRRPIDDNFMYTAMSNINFVTYDITDSNTSNNGGADGGVVGSNVYNQEYNQQYRRDSSKFVDFNTIQSAFKLEGVVVGAYTSNIGNASGNSNDPAYGSSFYPFLSSGYSRQEGSLVPGEISLTKADQALVMEYMH